MKSIGAVLFLLLGLLLLSAPKIELHQKIELKPDMIINETALGDARLLVDEQKIAGDPLSGHGGICKNYWFPGWINDEFGGVSAVIDLGYTYELSNIALFGTRAKGTIEIFVGNPKSWKKVIADSTINYRNWNIHPVKASSQYIRISCNSRNLTAELVVYGKKNINITTQSAQKPYQKRPFQYPIVEEMMGVNAFVDDPIEKLMPFSWIREYHDWEWNDGNKDTNTQKAEYKWAPSYPYWDFDQYYTTLYKKNILVVPCIQNCPSWRYQQVQNKPVHDTANAFLPSSYLSHGRFMFHFAARYGSEKNRDTPFQNASEQTNHSGLGLIKYLENYNEPDKMWMGRKPRFHPYEYAAMASADYDGHLCTMGKDIGVKNADKNIKMVMAGLSSMDTNYLKAIKFWSMHHRRGSLPFDVLNLHHYSQNIQPQYGISPESDSLASKLKKLVSFRNQHFGNTPIWLSEFGYDTHPQSSMRAGNDEDNVEEQQAVWLLRYMIILSASGIDKAAIYMLRDVDAQNSTKYSTSGLTSTQKTGYQPKKSWHYLHTLRKSLGKYRFDEVLKSNIAGIEIYRYKHAINAQKAWVIWYSGTEKKYSKSLQMYVSSKKTRLLRTEFEHIQAGINFRKSVESKDNGLIYLDVTEKPIILEMQ